MEAANGRESRQGDTDVTVSISNPHLGGVGMTKLTSLRRVAVGQGKWAMVLCALVLAGCQSAPAPDLPGRLAPDHEMTVMSLPQFGPYRARAPMRANGDLVQDFLDLTFHMESGRALARLTKFEGPITVALAPQPPAALGDELDRLITRLRNEARIDIRRIPDGARAQITITALPQDLIQSALPDAACFVVPNTQSWNDYLRNRNRATLDWAALERRETAAIFLPVDVSPQEMRDCLHEELGQALGPLNDLYHLTDSIFNDDNFHGVLTGHDMLMLAVYNDPRLRNGMSIGDVAQALPALFDQYNPAGRSAPSLGPRQEIARDWINAIEAAMRPRMDADLRLRQAQQAIAIAQNRRLDVAQNAFSHYVTGRLIMARDPEGAAQAFLRARALYQTLPDSDLQLAHIAMHQAALALGANDPARALDLTAQALPAARQAEHGVVLATLYMIRAAAFEARSAPEAARDARAQALIFGRFAYGSDARSLDRLSQIAALIQDR